MSAGLLQLVSISQRKNIMIDKPEITFFEIVYKSHINFAIVPFNHKFNTTAGFGTKITCVLNKNGDYINKSYIVVDLPNLQEFTESNILDNDLIFLWSIYKDSLNQLAWTKYIGYRMIKYVEIEINWMIIEKHSGEWLYLYDQITSNKTKQDSINKMIGNIWELTDFWNGKTSYRLYIPLSFWFCRNNNNMLNIGNIKNLDVKIHVEFETIDNCLIIAPTHSFSIIEAVCWFTFGDIIYQNINNTIIFAKFIGFDDYNNILYFIALIDELLFSFPNSEEDNLIQYRIFNFNGEYITPSIGGNITIVNSLSSKNFINTAFNNIINTSFFNWFLWIDYLLLDQEIIRNDDIKLIDTIYGYDEYIISNNNFTIPLNVNYPCKEIFIVPQLINYSSGNLKEVFNFSLMLQDVFKFYNDYNKKNGTEIIVPWYTNFLDPNIFDVYNSNIIKSISIKYNNNQYNLSDYIFYNFYDNRHINVIPFGILSINYSLLPDDNIYSGYANLNSINNVQLSFILDNWISYTNQARIRIYFITLRKIKLYNGVFYYEE